MYTRPPHDQAPRPIPALAPDNASAMSEENVELVRRIYDTWGRREPAYELVAEDVEYVNPPYAVEPGTQILWLSPHDAIAVLTHQSHRWAVAQINHSAQTPSDQSGSPATDRAC